MMTSLHDVTARGWRRRAMTYSTGRRRGGANGRLRAADVAGGHQRLAVLPTTVDDVTAGGERRRARCSADRAARTGARRADGRRRVAKSPMTSVASRGFEVGAVSAGGAGDVSPSRRVRARRRERATISDRRGGLAATVPARPGDGLQSRRTALPAPSRWSGDTRRCCCRSVAVAAPVGGAAISDRPSAARRVAVAATCDGVAHGVGGRHDELATTYGVIVVVVATPGEQ